MAGDASVWLESVKEYLQPVARVAMDMKEQIEGCDLPPAMVKIYKTTAGAVGVEDMSPFYVGLGIVAAGSALLLATCSCSSGGKAAGRKKKKVPAKKKKTKAKSKSGSVASNGSAHKNGDVSGSGTSNSGGGSKQTVVPMANGSAPRGLPSKEPEDAGVRGVGDADYAGGGGADVDSPLAAAAVSSKGDASKPAKKSAATKPGKAWGKPAGDDPPVITEEPEAAKKRVRKKKTKAAVAAAAAGGGSAGGASAVKKDAKRGPVANGSAASAARESRAAQKETPTVELDVWEEQSGGEWQSVPVTPLEAEWETVSHKKTRPRKEKAAADGANVIPGGLGL